jgi:hypothetical protein
MRAAGFQLSAILGDEKLEIWIPGTRIVRSWIQLRPQVFRFSAFQVGAVTPRSPRPRVTETRQFGPVRSVRTRNSMDRIDFSVRRASGFRSGVRDRFGRDHSPRGTPKNHFGFFGFRGEFQSDSGTHNPLVPYSSPGGPTDLYRIHSVMTLRPGDSSPLVWAIGGMSGALLLVHIRSFHNSVFNRCPL